MLHRHPVQLRLMTVQNPRLIVATLQQKFEMDFMLMITQAARSNRIWRPALAMRTSHLSFAEQELKKRGFTDVDTLNFGSSLWLCLR